MDADAVRYRVLMRVAPALRHGVAGQLQSVHFTSETLTRRMARAATLDEARAAAAMLPEQAKALAERAQPLMRWLRPDAPDRLSLDAIAHEACDLLNVDLSLRDIALEREGGSTREAVAAPLLQLLVAAMLAVGDRCGAGAALIVEVGSGEEDDRFAVRRRGPGASSGADSRLAIGCADVAMLAAADGFRATGDESAITISAPRRRQHDAPLR